ncbi:MAG: HAMP domain-containing protein [Candidatus Brocadia sp.]|nr:MAG: HAMP domain-containing protein [Candidatus Brocadia sp.]
MKVIERFVPCGIISCLSLEWWQSGLLSLPSFWGRKFLPPFATLREFPKIIANGSYRTRVDYQSDDEVGELAHAINKMVETLEKKSQMPESMTGEKDT